MLFRNVPGPKSTYHNSPPKMGQNGGSDQPTSKLLKIAGLLRNADKLMREGRFLQASEFISKALSIDSSNGYTKAYAERLQILVDSASTRQSKFSSNAAASNFSPRSFSRFLENNVHGAEDTNAGRSISDRRENEFDSMLGRTFLNDVSNAIRLDDSRLLVRRSITVAEAMLREGRFDEAMNSLAAAIIVDPLNAEVVTLQRLIRKDSLEQKWDGVRSGGNETATRDTDSGGAREAVHHRISRAMRLADAGDFYAALAELGHSYLINPLSEDVAACERLIHNAMRLKNGDDDISTFPGSSEMKHTKTKQQLVAFLDKAQELLDHDRFGEALSYVVRAMKVAPNAEAAESGTVIAGFPPHDRSPEFIPPADRSTDRSSVSNEISMSVRSLLEKSEKLAAKGDVDQAANVLLNAAAMIPADGSLIELDRLVARKFMEYSSMLRLTAVRSQSEGAFKNRERQGGFVESAPVIPRTVEKSKYSDTRTVSPYRPPLNPMFDDGKGSDTSFVDRLSRLGGIQDSVLQTLNHLNGESLKEASASANAASLLDPSRSDVRTLAENVSSLAQKVGNRVVLASSLMGSFESVRQQCKTILYRLYYEQLIAALDRGLEVMPDNDVLLKRKADVAEALEQCNLATEGLEKRNDKFEEMPAKMPAAVAKTKKRPLDQMSLSFPGEMGRRVAQG